MRRRIIKQLIYGLFFIFIISAISYVVYVALLEGPVSCVDGVRNQKEEDIDCGGPCMSCVQKHAIPLKAEIVRVIPFGARVFAILTFINPNTALGADRFDYIIEVHDTNDVLIHSETHSSFLYAGETKIIAEPDLLVKYNPRHRTSVRITDTKWNKILDIKAPQIDVVNIITSFAEDEIIIKGEIRNKEAREFPSPVLHIILRDKDRNGIGGTRTVLGARLRAFDSESFQAMIPAYDGLQKADPRFTQIFVEAR
ncbi:MAG: hypothetical protein A2586_01680 [Candidatus Harrisonbacteria bacterium RIFOXYD1_FULL_40_9]|uniref:Uncharacterized protein n=1 Tax=Candidatus Harrisonbacteria bacterium RIFOXYD1_FULL_40_9 TaxID=1798412 RepID=A0A1G1ZWV8_9BACT|nr:MAG: hypothetical protein A2586_01680 [Candidatus Harrisonbacteria bacterium RIFOXYD1_FULL_40_9]